MSLQILSYDPNDYKLEEALSLPHGSKVEDQATILRIVSLYLNWISKANLEVYIDKDKSSGRPGAISVDPEERSPSQLFISTTNIIDKTSPEFIYVRLHIFEKCYDFEMKVLEVFEENGGSTYVTDLPTSISTVKARKIPRITLDESTAKVYSITNNTSYPISVLSPNSVIVNGRIDNSQTIFSINGNQFNGEIKPISDTKCLITPTMSTPESFGAFFTAYASVAFPSIRPVSSISFDERFKLYLRAGYFAAFNDNNEEALRKSIVASWESLTNAQHSDVVDFVATNHEEVVGCSSLAKAFKENGIDVWVFHQLCAIKNDENLAVTKELYRWRAEYISGLPTEVIVRLWFKSSSRWLERIYVKFALAKGRDILMPITLKSHEFKSESLANSWSPKAESKIGRTYYNNSSIFGASAPEYLNASRLMNMVYTEQALPTGSLMEIAAQSGQEYMVTCHPYDPAELNGTILPSDRMVRLSKDDMIDFIACLEHSIAVTIQKRRGVSEKD